MNYLRFHCVFLFVVFEVWLTSVVADISDPYKILDIGNKATLPDIRKAYKKLAKEWWDKHKNGAGRGWQNGLGGEIDILLFVLRPRIARAM